MSDSTNRNAIKVETKVAKKIGVYHLIALEKAFDALGIPWVKGIRITHAIDDEGVYFNSEPGVNLVSVTGAGITMPTIVDAVTGVGLSGTLFTEYTYDELFIRIMDIVGPSRAKTGIDTLKQLAKSA